MSWRMLPFPIEIVSEKVRDFHRNVREPEVQLRPRLGLSEQEVQSQLRPKPNILIMAGRLTKRPRAASTAEGMTQGD